MSRRRIARADQTGEHHQTHDPTTVPISTQSPDGQDRQIQHPAPAPNPPPPLPCQYSDNGTSGACFPEEYLVQDHCVQIRRDERKARSKEPLQSHHRKTALALRKNAPHLIETHGEDRVGLLTLTCRSRTTPFQCRKFFSKFWKQHLRHLFEGVISVVDVQNGRPHIHALVLCPHDIASGFNKTAYLEMREISQNRLPSPQERERLGRNLTPNLRLKTLWGKLRGTVSRAGFARRVELTPLLKTPECLVGYLEKAYLRGVEATRRPRKPGSRPNRSRVRILCYSKEGSSTFSAHDLLDLPSLLAKLRQPTRAVDSWLVGQLAPDTKAALVEYEGQESDAAPTQVALLHDLNRLREGTSIFEQDRFAGVELRPETQSLLLKTPPRGKCSRLNRLLIEDAFPLELRRGSKDLDRIFRLPFGHTDSRPWRRQVAAIAKVLGVTQETFKLHYGPKWAYQLQGVLEELTTYHGPIEPENWPPEAIRRIVSNHMTLTIEGAFALLAIQENNNATV